MEYKDFIPITCNDVVGRYTVLEVYDFHYWLKIRNRTFFFSCVCMYLSISEYLAIYLFISRHCPQFFSGRRGRLCVRPDTQPGWSNTSNMSPPAALFACW